MKPFQPGDISFQQSKGLCQSTGSTFLSPHSFTATGNDSNKPVRAIPLPLNLVEALGAICFTVQEPELGLLVALSFHCFLRTAEMLSLQWNHLLTQSDRRTINVVLPFSKTSEGNPQVLRLENQCLWQVVQKLRPPSLETAPALPGV